MSCKSRLLRPARMAFAVGSILLPLRAQDQAQPLHLVANSPHEVRDLVVALQMRGWLVTFEEGPIQSTTEVETKTTPTGLPVLVRRVVPVTFDVSAQQLSVVTAGERVAALEPLLAAYSKTGLLDSYRVSKDGLYLHVIPWTIADEAGKPSPFEPMLSTKVSFPEQRFPSLISMMTEVLNQVSEQRGTPIVLGVIPNNLFHQGPVMAVANNEPARDVLARAFFELNGPRLADGTDPVGLPWTLVYDPTNRQYWFSVNAVHIEIPGVNRPKNAPTKNTQQEEQTNLARPNGRRKIQ